MSALIDIYIKASKLQELINLVESENKQGINITVSIEKESNDYGNNVKSYIRQSKEEIEAKAAQKIVGYGKVFWTDGKIERGRIKK